MKDTIDARNLIEKMRGTFPELEVDFSAEVEKWRGDRLPSNYDVVGFVFKPRFKEEIGTGEITDFLVRSAAFMECVCETGDLEAINVIWIKIFEWLILSRPDGLKLLWPVLGENTRKNIRDTANRWRSSESLPDDL